MCRLALVMLLPLAVPAAELRGRIRDASTGELLARVRIQCSGGPETETAADGTFSLTLSPPATLRISAVGYQAVTRRVDSPANEEIDLALHPDGLPRREQVTVRSAPQEEIAQSSRLAGGELRQLSGALADDPFRAVQGMPGVTSSDDFQSSYSIRGAAFERTGVYLDGVLLNQPFHTVRADPSAASLAALNGEVMDSVTLFAGAAPVHYRTVPPANSTSAQERAAATRSTADSRAASPTHPRLSTAPSANAAAG